jgi:hypothetical protein
LGKKNREAAPLALQVIQEVEKAFSVSEGGPGQVSGFREGSGRR